MITTTDTIKLFDKQLKELEKLKNLIYSDEIIKQKASNICRIKRNWNAYGSNNFSRETNGFEF
jgi:hypothetical protein